MQVIVLCLFYFLSPLYLFFFLPVFQDPLPPSAPPVSMEMTDGSSGIVVSSFGKINAAVDDDMDGDTEF